MIYLDTRKCIWRCYNKKGNNFQLFTEIVGGRNRQRWICEFRTNGSSYHRLQFVICDNADTFDEDLNRSLWIPSIQLPERASPK
jgi:hypothetical protein